MATATTGQYGATRFSAITCFSARVTVSTYHRRRRGFSRLRLWRRGDAAASPTGSDPRRTSTGTTCATTASLIFPRGRGPWSRRDLRRPGRCPSPGRLESRRSSPALAPAPRRPLRRSQPAVRSSTTSTILSASAGYQTWGHSNSVGLRPPMVPVPAATLRHLLDWTRKPRRWGWWIRGWGCGGCGVRLVERWGSISGIRVMFRWWGIGIGDGTKTAGMYCQVGWVCICATRSRRGWPFKSSSATLGTFRSWATSTETVVTPCRSIGRPSRRCLS